MVAVEGVSYSYAFSVLRRLLIQLARYSLTIPCMTLKPEVDVDTLGFSPHTHHQSGLSLLRMHIKVLLGSHNISRDIVCATCTGNEAPVIKVLEKIF